MNISDIAKIMDSLTKLRPEEIANEIQKQTQPVVQLLAGISNTLDLLNQNIEKLNDTLSKKDNASVQ